MNGYFVTGTDTGAGKTVVSALLCLAINARYFKPIQTGNDADTDTVALLAGLPPERIHAPVYTLKAPLAPSQAAQSEGLTLDASRIRLPEGPGPIVVEGAGGALVPIAPGQDMRWLMTRLRLPVIVAARSALGTINHTLLTLEALRLHGLDIAGVIMSGPLNAANRSDIERLGGVPVLLELPALPTMRREDLVGFAARLTLPREKAISDVPELDSRHVWHPFTQAATAPQPLHVVRASGPALHLAHGQKLLDMVSSWWVNPHGHCHPAIAQAIARQAHTLEHVIFADCTHEPAARLASELCRLLPEGLARVFYSDNGSTAVEVAIKMAHQYWRNQGRTERNRFAAFQGGYHGDTVGAMSVGLSSGFHNGFEPLTFKVDYLPYPATWHGDAQAPEKLEQCLAILENYFSTHAGTIAGMILEPLVQGASGMRLASPRFVREAAALCRKAQGLVIFDEVMTGFGRTGTLFACQKAQVSPDIICLAKGLTAGFTPMAATVATQTVYDGFLGGGFGRALAHGHSFTANPLGCAAALAGLALFTEEAALDRVAALEAVHRQRLSALADHPKLARPRWLGCIGAVDITAGDSGYGAQSGKNIKRYFMEKNFYIRPLGEVVYFMPPYCLPVADLHRAYDTLEEALTSL